MYSNLLTFSLTVFAGFFAVMNPIANVPIFMGLVGNEDEASKRRISRMACITAFVILFFFILLGQYIFKFFGLTVPAFKITGGILIFYVGFEMVLSKTSQVRQNVPVSQATDVAITPLGIPILAGPGTIVTGMNFVSDTDWIKFIIVILIAGLIVLFNFVAFRSGGLIVRKLGRNIILVLGKLMGLMLAIIGMGMLIEGVKLAFYLQ